MKKQKRMGKILAAFLCFVVLGSAVYLMCRPGKEAEEAKAGADDKMTAGEDGKTDGVTETDDAEAYVPIPEGFIASKSVAGDLTDGQRKEIDEKVRQWQSGVYEDIELKAELEAYLREQQIGYLEVSVTSEGYNLLEEVPEIGLADDGNLYSFLGIYSTGQQNPEGTDSTICYHWSVFIF